jgi:hypothetical protein
LEFRRGKPVLTGFLLERDIGGTGYMIPRTMMVRELGVIGSLKLRAEDVVPLFGTEFGVEIVGVEETEGTVSFQLKKD